MAKNLPLRGVFFRFLPIPIYNIYAIETLKGGGQGIGLLGSLEALGSLGSAWGLGCGNSEGCQGAGELRDSKG